MNKNRRIEYKTPTISAPPTFDLDFPLNYSLYGKLAPDYSLSKIKTGNYTWYEFMDISTNSTPVELMGTVNEDFIGTFNQSMWDSLSNGTATIRFYVNNSLGEISFLDAIIRIDIEDPSIDSIDYPSPGAWFSATPPSYSLSITEKNLDTIWYTLDGGINNYTGATSGTIDSTAWTNAGDGAVTITFYVNDSVGNWASSSVGVNKDSLDPIIDSIDSPSPGAWYSSAPPGYSLSITEANLDSIWYTLDGGTNNYTGATSGTIDSTAWTNAGDGAVTITFYVNDTVGNIDFASIGVNKDTLDPSIDSIDSPSSGAWFSSISPSYSLSITETNLDSIWYTLDEGTNNYTGAVSGTIDSTAWTNAGDGAVTITFYVNDSMGNWDTASVIVNKDTLDPSIDSVDSPSPGTWFSATPPSYSLSITEANLDSIWYTLDGGTNNYTGATSGTIDSTAWTNAGDGAITITFYVNDSVGNWDVASIGINKDTLDPSIDSIDSPSSGAWFSSVPPSYSLSITEANLDSIWYTLDGGSNNYTGATSGTIDSTAWTNAGDGAVTITFYVNDSVGNLDTASVVVNKDTIDPSIDNIDSPLSGAWFAGTPPSYTLSITETNLNTIWYTLDGGATNYTGATSGMIDSTAWTNAGDGLVTITFYVNDSAGNLNFASVIINKDSVNPSIDSINSPSSGAWFNNNPPSYSLSITETNLDSIWYTLDGGTNNYTGTESGTINLTAWTNAGDGLVTITFYVNDSAGNMAFVSVDVNKDTLDPSIDSIDLPSSGAWFGSNPPSYSLSITETNLDSIWYTLDGGTNNYTGGASGTIDSTAWTNAGDGLVTITFYVNDSAGNIDFASVAVNKDTLDPSIDSIDSPSPGVWFSSAPPSYSLSITETNLDSIWYTLDGGTNNYTGATSGTIDSTAWTNAGDGLVTITFYINDSAGNIDFTSVGVNKDTLDPSIDSIDSPSPGTWFSATPPSYSLSITEANLDSIWYTLDGGTNNYTGATSGTIDFTAWTNAVEGAVTITFYVNDSVGNLDTASVIVNKDSADPSINSIDSPSSGAWFSNTPLTYSLSITETNLDEIWYTLDGGINNYTGAESGTINPTAWTNAGDGTVTITFYVNDSAGNMAFASVDVNKDTLNPSIDSINSPSSGAWFSSNPPSYSLSITETNLGSIWYTLDGGTNNYTGAISGTINSTAWTNAGQGAVTITFYVNDSAGNWASSSVVINKDSVAPSIDSIDSPSPGVWFSSTPPSYSLSITETNLDSIWYTLDGGANNYTGATSGTIDSTAWTNAGQGAVTMTFYVNDSAGNWASSSVVINKDSVDPSLDSIDSPSSGAWFSSSPPPYSLSITETNLDSIWYTLDGGANNYTGGTSGIINSTAWTNAGDGLVTITFYVNDSAGNWASSSVVINKDSVVPSIDSIDSPSPGVWFSSAPPSYGLSITEANLDSIWYTLDGGSTNYTGAVSGMINSTAWTNAGQGAVTVTFYVNDSAGNWASSSVVINKDSVDPSIDSIDSPSSGEWFSSSPPSYTLSITETNLDSIWYTLDGGTNNYTGAISGTIDSTAWTNAGQGAVTVMFYANDSAGNWAYSSVVINKDSVDPSIDSIDSPSSGAWFSSNPPSYSLSITETNLDSIWYTLDGGLNNYAGAASGTIDVTAWSNAGQGAVTITFYINDSASNLDFASVVVNKDTLPPILVLNTPINNTYVNNAPPINITVYDKHFATLTYTVLGEVPLALTNNTAITLNQAIWSSLSQGVFYIFISGYDLLGQFSNLTITLYKDTIAPIISITSPVNNTYSNLPPYLNVNAVDPNLDTIWYSVNNVNITLQNNTLQELNSSIWASLPDEGQYEVKIYANDTFGHLNDLYTLNLYKDIIYPTLTINSPLNNSYYKVEPIINVVVSDPYFDSLWYRVGAQNIPLINNTNQQLTTSIWNSLPEEGSFIIYFYANDSAGNLNNLFNLTLNKDVRNPEVLITNPNPNDLFGEPSPEFQIFINELNLNTTWYMLYNNSWSSLNYTFSGLTGVINQLAWDAFKNTDVTIRFYANDTLNNLGYTEVTIRKNIIAPIMTIVDPQDYDLFGIEAPNITIYKAGIELNTTWYTLDGGLTNFTFSGLSVVINQDAWDSYGFSDVIITFYVNDSLGRIGFDQIILKKDPYPPQILITFINPSTNNSYCAAEPTFRIAAYDPNLVSIWYRVGLTNITFTNDTVLILNDTIWNSLPQGKFTIEIFAVDQLGYLNDSITLTFHKDTLAPKLVINQPEDYSYYDSPPPLNVTVFDPNYLSFSLTYTVVGHLPDAITLENNTEEFLNLAIWNSLPQGEFSVSITARDTFNQRNDTFVLTLYKDTIGPVFESLIPGNFSTYNSPPTLMISYSDPNLQTIYYKVGTSPIIPISNGISQDFDSSIWSGLIDAPFTIEFYANDTFGHMSTVVNLTLIKDTTIPRITINSPSNNTYYSAPPTMNLVLLDPNPDTIWYTVLGSKVTLTGIQPFDSSIWNSLGQGEFEVYIFANDTAGNLNNTLILTLLKDTKAPLVTVNLPLNNSYWNDRLKLVINVEAFDPNLYSIQYYVDGVYVTLQNGNDSVLLPIFWKEDGPFTIQIFASDIFGHTNDSIILTLYKDTIPPNIDIISPQPNDLFGENAPFVSIDVTDTNLEEIWYRLSNGTVVTNNYPWTGSIDQSVWDQVGNGTVTIRFYANDTATNVHFEDIVVKKNLFAPIISINYLDNHSPYDPELFGIIPPYFEIYKSGSELQSTWYKINNGITNYTFTGLSGTINQSAWDDFGSGTVHTITLTFYVNDSLGKIGFDEIIIRKDIDIPTVVVNSPVDQTPFASSPLLDLTVTDPNLHKVWYSVNGETRDITNNLTVFLNISIWNSLSDGSFTIEFFANDTMGNLNNLRHLDLSKDTTGPTIEVIRPTDNQRVGRNAPYFEVQISDINGMDSSWYRLIGYGNNTLFYGPIDRVDVSLWENLWDSLPDGSVVTLRFISNDTLGNVDFIDVDLIINKPALPPRLFQYPLGFLIPSLGLVALIPFTVKLTKTRYYKSLNNKDRRKLRNALITAGFFLSLLAVYFVF
jgi:hypothetical protein